MTLTRSPPGHRLNNGSKLLCQWADDSPATPDELELLAGTDEAAWLAEREAVLLYR
ncbi:MAG: hypothetical protein WCH04_12065 [Gammaproteobacteria bacterium]